MEQNQPLPTQPQPLISKDAFLLACFALITTGLCVFIFALTDPKISENRKARTIATIAEVAPAAVKESNLLSQWIYINDSRLGHKKTHQAYVIQPQSGQETWILPLRAPDGYGGHIDLLMGISSKGEITGVRVIPPHNETSGLGDKIDLKKSQWVLSFNGLSLENTTENQWAVDKEGGQFDSFTGATITPRAVVNAVHRALIYFNNEQESLNTTPLKTKAQNRRTPIPTDTATHEPL